MIPLPGEGGFFVSTWTSPEVRTDGRPLGSAILFLITETDFSALHRLRSDEIWHFNSGDPMELARLDPVSASVSLITLGPDVAGGELPQAIVPAGHWQGARICPNAGGDAKGWTLLGCTVTPAWDEGEFELGQRDALLAEFPAHGDLIRSLTR
jgi:predicted cupin superfamily sugar epimerase